MESTSCFTFVTILIRFNIQILECRFEKELMLGFRRKLSATIALVLTNTFKFALSSGEAERAENEGLTQKT